MYFALCARCVVRILQGSPCGGFVTTVSCRNIKCCSSLKLSAWDFKCLKGSVKCYLSVCVRHVVSALSCADEYSCMLIYVMSLRLKKLFKKKCPTQARLKGVQHRRSSKVLNSGASWGCSTQARLESDQHTARSCWLVLYRLVCWVQVRLAESICAYAHSASMRA